ncbi:tRNA lysidine(34) synthetase TilS [Candidatus Peregrinibacteria bacterium]|nr:MAG: tRNA lysidine(34) synthetase TilS [Candidatus Peregrinibacteria bacterium]
MKLSLELKQIPKDSTLLIGVSGGRDSMALVHALMNQRKDLKLVAAHMNHGLRDSAESDAEFVKGMMLRWELPFELFKPRPPSNGNMEEWGREKRYEFFEKIAKKHKVDFIVTAHHQDDDFESMMLHFVRGTRVKGLSGMAFHRSDFSTPLLRPLLYTSRAEINAYIGYHEIPYRDDPTNEDETLARNFLRNKIIPVLTHVYPGLAERWQKQKPYWLDLQKMLETSALTFMQEFLDKKEGLSREAYGKLPYPLRATVLERWYQDSTGRHVPDAATLERWDNAILTFETRKKTEWNTDPSSKKNRFLSLSKERAKLI